MLSRPLNRKYLFNVSADHFEPVHNQPLPILVINTIDPSFFIANIKNGYDMRKTRHFEKNNQPITMAQEMYNLVMNSNQIVHNRDRALAFLGNSYKKHRQSEGGRPRHEYSLAVNDLSTSTVDLMARHRRFFVPKDSDEGAGQMMMIGQQAKRRPDMQVHYQAYGNFGKK